MSTVDECIAALLVAARGLAPIASLSKTGRRKRKQQAQLVLGALLGPRPFCNGESMRPPPFRRTVGRHRSLHMAWWEGNGHPDTLGVRPWGAPDE
jgi:hypothetical protein